MHWYGGSIAEAVNLSKQRNAIFVVFVEGDNDLSVEMATTIDDSAIVKRLSDETNFLAVKLNSGSPNYMHFAQLYQFVPVPSLFFIGRNGTPLEVVCAGVQPTNLAERIDRILQEHYKNKPSIQPSTSGQNIRDQTLSFMQSEAAAANSAPAKPARAAASEREPETSAPAAKIQKTEHKDDVTKSSQEYDVVCDGDVCVRKPKVGTDEAGPSQRSQESEKVEVKEQPAASADSSASSIEDKMERAKELIEARRREKEQKEKEAEKQKELERRTTGQGVAELKRWQAEQELKQMQEERKREKMENNLARQRILEQIAQDRAERRAREAPHHAPPPAQTAPPTLAPTSGDGRSSARVQFKLPDGTSHTAQFDASGTVADLHRYVAENLHLSFSSFSLWTAFPRRELTDTEATLRQLHVAPSAALLVLPRHQPAAVARPNTFANVVSFFSHFFTFLVLEPTQQLVNWVRARLFPPPVSPSPPTGGGNQPPTRHQPPTVRRRGNIHRLSGDRQSDDENNTWNGNSTQQM